MKVLAVLWAVVVLVSVSGESRVRAGPGWPRIKRGRAEQGWARSRKTGGGGGGGGGALYRSRPSQSLGSAGLGQDTTRTGPPPPRIDITT